MLHVQLAESGLAPEVLLRKLTNFIFEFDDLILLLIVERLNFIALADKHELDFLELVVELLHGVEHALNMDRKGLEVLDHLLKVNPNGLNEAPGQISLPGDRLVHAKDAPSEMVEVDSERLKSVSIELVMTVTKEGNEKGLTL